MGGRSSTRVRELGGTSMATKVRPLHDRLIVQLVEESEQQVGGIIIPDTAKEKP